MTVQTPDGERTIVRNIPGGHSPGKTGGRCAVAEYQETLITGRGPIINLRQLLAPPGLWLLLAAIPAALAALLTAAIVANPIPSQDLAILNWIRGWDLPGLSAFFTVVDVLTSLKAGLIYGAAGLAGLLIARMHKTALVFVLVGAVAAAVSFLGDYALGDLVDRSGPMTGSSASSYPSGHVFGGALLFGFLAFLTIQHRLQHRLSIPVVVLAGLLIVGVGPARIHEGDHWPSDVAAGYLLAWALLMVLFPVYRRYLETGLGLGLTQPRLFSGVKRTVTKWTGSSKAAR